MSTPLINIDWTATGIVPDDMEFWHQYEYGVSENDSVLDYSGNARHLVAAATAPVITSDEINGQPAWYFDGSAKPLVYTGSVDVQHVFVIARATEATFSAYRGLLSAPTSDWGLIGETGTTRFYDLSGSVTYKKNDTAFAHTTMSAPMNEWALLEYLISPTITVDGIQIGQQINLTARKWLGYWAETIGYSRQLTYEERRRVHLHFNLKYRVFKYGVPLYFPSKDLVPMLTSQTRVHNRFKDTPQDWSEITDTYKFQDGGEDFNEVADDMPREWEYLYQNVPKVQKVVFDEFNNAARRAVSFSFKDPENIVWAGVRIKSYDRNHDAHKRWRHDVPFVLRGGTSATYEAPPDTSAPCVPTGLTVTSTGAHSLHITWDAATDDCGGSSGGGTLEVIVDDTGDPLFDG